MQSSQAHAKIIIQMYILSRAGSSNLNSICQIYACPQISALHQ